MGPEFWYKCTKKAWYSIQLFTDFLLSYRRSGAEKSTAGNGKSSGSGASLSTSDEAHASGPGAAAAPAAQGKGEKGGGIFRPLVALGLPGVNIFRRFSQYRRLPQEPPPKDRLEQELGRLTNKIVS